jgi:hypothetical protein
MKRYLIFAALGPLLGGFLLLLTSTAMSGYWSHHPSASETEKLLAVFARTLQYSYLFGILPTLMIAAVDDILFHVKRIGPIARVLILGALAFIAGIALWLPGAGQRCAPVHPVRPSGACPRDDLLVAGA